MRLQKSVKVLSEPARTTLHRNVQRMKRLQREQALQVFQGAHTVLRSAPEETLTGAIADANADIPVVLDAVAMARYVGVGFELGRGCLHGENDCLPDSLLQCMSAAGILPARPIGAPGTVERGHVCKTCRAELLQHENARLRPDPWKAFLEENAHGPDIVQFFFERFKEELLRRPQELVLVTHSRFDACVQDSGTSGVIEAAMTTVRTLLAQESAEKISVELHMYSETGLGHRGLHFSPILKLPGGPL